MPRIIRHEDIKPGDHFLIVEQLGSGWAAIEMWLNDEDQELGTFPEPYNSGLSHYATREQAIMEMQQWAESDDLPILDYCAK